MNIQELESKIVKASEAYYLQTPIMTDKEFDSLLDQLREQDPQNKILTSVGWGLRVYGNKVKIPKEIQSSLPKIKTVNDLGADELFVSLKVDGMSVILEYENGILKYALTRGDGVYGVDITEKAKYINGIATVKEGYSLTHIVRGELFIGIKEFNDNLAQDYANPRNAVAGIVNSKSLELLEFVSFIEHPFQPQTVNEQLKLDKVNSSIDWEVYFKEFKDKNNYPVDGLCVIDVKKFDELKDKDEIINHVYALKLATEEVETEITKIEWNLSDRGKFIPIVHYKPVNLYGTVCKQASGYNYQYVKENNIGEGTIISLTKANEIIPYITSVVKSSKFEEPIIEEYPTKLEGVHLVVNDKNYLRTLLSNNFLAYHFNFDGYKKANLLLKIFDLTTLSGLASFVHLRSAEELDEILKNNSVNSTVRPILIDKLKNGKLKLNNFFSHFGINGVGESASESLQEIIGAYCDVADLHILMTERDKTIGRLEQVLDRVKINKNVREILKNVEIAEVIAEANRVFSSRWFLEEKEVKDLNGKITAVITGSLSMTKKDMAKKLEAYGILVSEKLSKDTNILITNDKSSGSSKMKFAEKNGIEILTEQELYQKFNIN